MGNKYTGEVEVKIDGQKCTLIYDWRAIGEIQSKYGLEVIRGLLQMKETNHIADILAIGLKKHHPNLTQEVILDLSPPFVPMVAAMDKALTYAYFGPGLEKKKEVKEEEEPSAKKTK